MTQAKRHIHVNAFNMNCVGHIHHGLWTHPRDRSTEYGTLAYWTHIARVLEEGLFDGIFIADVVGYYDVYQGGVDLTLREGIQLPVNNPWLLVSAMAAVTPHIGFGLTATVPAHQPYTFARDVTTLDHLTHRAIVIHMSAPSPQRTPVLFQAGTSPRGLRFAGRHAEGIFIGARTPEAAREASRQLRQAAVDAGRRPEDIKIYAGVAVVPGRTEAEAREKYADYLSHASAESGLAHFAASTGVDFAQYGLDDPISFGNTNAIQSAAQAAQKQGWTTRRKLLEQFTLGSRYATIVGDPSQVADELERWIDVGEIDGFNLTRIVAPETWEDFARLVVPELQNRGRYRTSYGEDATLRQRLFGQGDRLPASHAADRKSVV